MICPWRIPVRYIPYNGGTCIRVQAERERGETRKNHGEWLCGICIGTAISRPISYGRRRADDGIWIYGMRVIDTSRGTDRRIRYVDTFNGVTATGTPLPSWLSPGEFRTRANTTTYRECLSPWIPRRGAATDARSRDRRGSACSSLRTARLGVA